MSTKGCAARSFTDDHHLDPGTHRSTSLDDQTARLCLAARRTSSGPAQAVQGPAEESIRPGEQGYFFLSPIILHLVVQAEKHHRLLLGHVDEVHL
jgi:hypothetical protein